MLVVFPAHSPPKSVFVKVASKLDADGTVGADGAFAEERNGMCELGLVDGESVGNLLPDGLIVGARLGCTLGDSEGFDVGFVDSDDVGTTLGIMLGVAVGRSDGWTLGDVVGMNEGMAVGITLGVTLGFVDGLAVGAYDGETLGITVG